MDISAKTMTERKRQQEVRTSPVAKRPRLSLKKKGSETTGPQHALHGTSSQQDVGMDAILRGIKLDEKPATIIAMDLETTGLIYPGQMPHITQIAAKVVGRKRTFSRYVKPKLPINPSAQQITGIIMMNDRMFVYGAEVAAIDIHAAIGHFLKWLTKFDNIVIAAHSGKRFDFPVLFSALKNLDKFDRFLSCVAGLLDSLLLYQQLYPDRSTYTQKALASEILNIDYNAHDATGDVFALCQLIKHAKNKMTKKDFLSHIFSPKAIHF